MIDDDIVIEEYIRDNTYRLLIEFEQMADGTVVPHLVPSPGIGVATNLNALFYMAELGTPLAGLAAQAMWELCEGGLVRHALRQARDIERGVRVMMPYAPHPDTLEPDLPVVSFAIN